MLAVFCRSYSKLYGARGALQKVQIIEYLRHIDLSGPFSAGCKIHMQRQVF